MKKSSVEQNMQQLLPERFRVYRAEGELIGLGVRVCVCVCVRGKVWRVAVCIGLRIQHLRAKGFKGRLMVACHSRSIWLGVLAKLLADGPQSDRDRGQTSPVPQMPSIVD